MALGRILTSTMAIIVTLSVFAGGARAVPAITDFTTLGFQNTNLSNDRTLGWVFDALVAIEVTHLGVWDEASDGLVASHRVGIWDSSGTLLGDSTVLAGTASVIAGSPSGGGSWRYETVAPVLLSAGNTYTIGALYDDDDIFDFFPGSVSSSSGIAFLEERYSEEGDGFVFPTGTFNRWGLFGPNFLYNEIAEPAALGLLALALASLVGLNRRRR